MNLKKIVSLALSAILLISAATVDAKKTDKNSAEKKAADKKISTQKGGTWQPERRIGLLSGITQVTLQMSEPCLLVDAETKKTIQKISANTNFTKKMKHRILIKF